MIDPYLTDEITIVKWEGYTSYGEAESGTLIDTKGRVVWKTRLVRDQKGEQLASEVMVYLDASLDVLLGRALSHEDRIQIGGESFDRAIISIRKPKDFAFWHYEVFLA
jgi:hypothetical protein